MSLDTLRLNGKTALITGGGRGIGAACARLLAARGAAIAVTYSKSANEAADLVAGVIANGGSGFTIKADVADTNAVKAGVAQAVDKLGGRLDILVNNAGISEHGAIGVLSDDAFDRLLDVNVRGVWHTTSAAIAHLGEAGRIINIGSFFSERVPYPGASAYGMTKHAVSGMTKGWARDLASRQITVNTVEPAYRDGGKPRCGRAVGEDQGRRPTRSLWSAGRGRRIGRVPCLACGAYITGAHILIDGGMLA